MAAVCTAWAGTGDTPDTVSKRQSFTDLVQVLQELGMRRAMFIPIVEAPVTNALRQG